MQEAAKQYDFEFSRKDFDAISKIAKENFGLNLSESKIPLVYSRLAKRIRVLGLSTFEEYRQEIVRPDNLDERSELLSALTTNVTHFFREGHHFDSLTEALKTDLIERARNGERIRLWSSACSTGQEAYSIALTVLTEFPDALDFDVKILATDIDQAVVAKAKAGSYPKNQCEGLDQRKFDRALIAEETNGQVDFSDKVKQLITFNPLNLIEPFPFKGPFDIIFCRNVAIYFDKDTQSKVWAALCSVLNTGGTLFIGHSERLNGPSEEKFESRGITTYLKVTP